MSCNGGDNCHEFYSQQAADAVRGDCVQLGQVISSQPCPHTLPDCCIETTGSYGNPEAICVAAGGWNIGPEYCNAKGETLCKR
jgi:hypothetical protein